MTNCDTLGWILYYACNWVPPNPGVFLYYCAVMTIIGAGALYLHRRKISWSYWLLILFCCYTWGGQFYLRGFAEVDTLGMKRVWIYTGRGQ